MLRKLKDWAKVLWTSPGSGHQVSADEESITCIDNEGLVSRVGWTDLIAIRVIPLETRPGANPLSWTLSTGTQLITFPDDARGATEVIRRLVCLPGFDTVRYQHVDDCSPQEGLVVWQRNGSS